MHKSKTIFRRILLSNVSIVVLCMSLLSAILFTFFSSYTIGEKKADLQNEVSNISQLVVLFHENQIPLSAPLYHITMNESARRINGIVFLIDNEGTVRIGSQHFSEHIHRKLPTNIVKQLLEKPFVQLGEFDFLKNETYLLVSEPIVYNGKTEAVVCTAVPMPHIHRYRNDIFYTVLWAIIATTLLTCIASFFISKRISKPLKNISNAAKNIMKGDFSVEVPVKGNDEIAVLSETFNQMTYSLRRLEEMRDGFISSVSHELRTPMTTISGFIEGILDDTIPKEKHEEYLTIVLEETKRLARLVNELLLVARMKDGLQLKKTEFNLNELIRVSILRFEGLFTEKNVEASISFDEDDCFISADKDALDRVFVNLFDNALKFNCPDGSVKVSVTQTDSHVTVTVENTGEGIPEKDLKLIWDKFYKTDQSRSKDKTGVGLGLYLVRNIILAHNGTIRAESKLNEYTRFTFTIPKK